MKEAGFEGAAEIVALRNGTVKGSLTKDGETYRAYSYKDVNGKNQNREPIVDVTNLKNGTATTATYMHSKNPIEVKKGDIILFGSGDKIIVHRVVKIEDINDEIRLYTKGDNNVQQDAGYITKEEYKGYVVFKVKQIGQPTIWVNDFFKRMKRG